MTEKLTSKSLKEFISKEIWSGDFRKCSQIQIYIKGFSHPIIISSRGEVMVGDDIRIYGSISTSTYMDRTEGDTLTLDLTTGYMRTDVASIHIRIDQIVHINKAGYDDPDAPIPTWSIRPVFSTLPQECQESMVFHRDEEEEG